MNNYEYNRVTIKDIRDWVAKLERVKGDCEIAHSQQDDIFETVLYEIAHGTPKAQRLAQEALKALDVDFDKYYS